MAIELPPLPYDLNALEPCISAQTLSFHYGKHHQNYVSKTNQLIQGTEFEKMNLREIILASQFSNESLFNNSAQVWNHNFYWQCMRPPASKKPSQALLNQFIKYFGSFDDFVTKFNENAKTLFGSGWTWLIQDSSGKLSIRDFRNADTPIAHHQKPLLTCDVWEHAYYLDYQNDRATYLTHFWSLVDWTFVESNLEAAPESLGPPPPL